MVSAAILMSDTMACVSISAFFQDGYPCGNPLVINLNSSAFAGNLAVDFNGRGKVGLTCAGSDSYVTFFNQRSALIDVWKAWRDGIWTSSVTVNCYGLASISPLPLSAGWFAAPATFTYLASKNAPCQLGGTCSTTLSGVVTFNDNGTVSVV